MDKPILTLKSLVKYAKIFCESESKFNNKELFGITDRRIVTLTSSVPGIKKIVNKVV